MESLDADYMRRMTKWTKEELAEIGWEILPDQGCVV